MCSARPLGLAVNFVAIAAIVAFAGWLLLAVASQLSSRYNVDETLIGSLGTGLLTSLPELVVTIAAVRRGALSLAVGGILGGNAFDALFLAASDVAWLDGSIYHAITPTGLFQLVISCLMATVLLLGLCLRQRSGPANMGAESVMVLVLYALSVLVMLC